MRRALLLSSVITSLTIHLAFPASNLYFPRLSFEPNTITGIAIVNPNAIEATVVLTAFGYDGKSLVGNGIKNPVTVRIEGGRQYAEITSVIFGGTFPANTVAWIRATSSSNDLTGFFLYLNPSISFLDGADLQEPATRLLFPQVRADGGYSTEINIVNPSAQAVPVRVSLHTGTDTSPADVILDPWGAVRFDVASVWDLGGAPGPLYVTADATTPIAGFEFVRGPGDLLGLNALDATGGAKLLYFPQMAVHSTIATELVVINLEDVATVLTFRAHKPDGALFGSAELTTNPATQPLGPGAILRLDAAGLFGFKGSDLKEGWVEVTSSSTAIGGTAGYQITGRNSLASVAASAQGKTRALFSHIATQLPFFTGVALVNSGSLVASVRLVAARKSDGAALGSYTTTLGPGQRISKQIDELIPAAKNQAGGLIWMTSNVPIHAISLFGSFQTLALANIPAQPVPDSFLPAGTPSQLKITPPLAVLQPGGSIDFNASGGGTVSWLVNGVPRGNDTFGRIDALGIYRAPSVNLPSPIPVSITAESTDGSQSAGAAVDLIKKETLLGNYGILSSVAYLASLQRLFTAELSGPGASEGSYPAQLTIDSRIYQVDPNTGGKAIIRDYSSDEVSKLVPYSALSKEYLLVIGRTSGRVSRLDPASKASTEVATGLNAPTAGVVDPLTGGLLVAEADQVTLLPASQLNLGLAADLAAGPDPSPSDALQTIGGIGGSGIAVDPCDGTVYLAQSQANRIVALNRSSGSSRTVISGLSNPTQMLGVLRSGVSCPEAFHLLVVQEGKGEVSLVLPSEGTIMPWIAAAGVRDIAGRPTGHNEDPLSGFFLAEVSGGKGAVSFVSEVGIYNQGGLIHSEIEVLPTVGLFTHYLDFVDALGDATPIIESYENYPYESRINPGESLNGIIYERFPGDTLGMLTPTFTSTPDPRYNAVGEGCLGLFRPGLPRTDERGYDYFFPGESLDIRFQKPVRAFGLFFNTQLPTEMSAQENFLYVRTGDVEVKTGDRVFDYYNVPGEPTLGLFFAGFVLEDPVTEVTIGIDADAPSGLVIDYLMRVE